MGNVIKMHGPSPSEITVGDAITAYCRRGVGRSDATYIARLLDEVGEIPLSRFTRRSVDLLITQDRRAKGLKNSSIRRELNTVQAILNHAHDIGLMDERVKVYKPSEDTVNWEWLSESEMLAFIDVCSDEFKPVAAFLFYTGARLGEALNARWDTFTNGCFVFRSRKGVNKREKVRSVPMHPALAKYLTPRSSGAVLARGNGFPWSRRGIYDEWKKARELIGRPTITPHGARHTFASILVMKGVDLRSVSELLGHSNMDMVKRYSHLSTAHLRGAITSLPE